MRWRRSEALRLLACFREANPRLTAIVLGAVTLFTLVPGLHAARRSTAAALSGGVSTGARRSRLGGLVDRLGLPLAAGVGARGTFARRGRTILTVRCR